MNELNKLLSSILLLGAGFFAASFIGPPEVVERLARYLQPTGELGEGDLRPVSPRPLPPAKTDRWAATPAATDTFAEAPQPTADRLPVGEGESPWPTSARTPAMTVGWPEPEATAAPRDDEWLTGASLADAPAPATPALKPIPRGEAASADAGDEWPTLAPPTVTTPPSLDDSPYGERPRFAADLDRMAPLRYEAARPNLDAIARRDLTPELGEHIVTDGDTLASLAERYLGDEGLSRRIFDLNADRLDHPEVLPIGMVLKLPAASRPSRASRPPQPARQAYGSLAASTPEQSLTRDPFPAPQRPMTSRLAGEDDTRPAEPAADPLFDRDSMWGHGGW